MPRTRSLAFSELKIGILAVIAIVIAAIVIFMLSGTGGFFWQRYSLKVRLANAAGLKTGAPVRLSGVEVGSVSDLQFVGAKVDVTFEVSKEQQARITDRSRATLASEGLLGQATIDISAASDGTPVQPWGYVTSGATPALSDVAATASQGLDQMTALLQDMRKGRGTVGQLFTNDAVYKDLDTFINAAQQVVSNLNKGQGTIGDLLKNPATAKSLRASMENLQKITNSIAAGQGALGQLLNDPQMASSLKTTTGNLASLSEGLQKGEGSAGKFLKDPALFNRIDALASRLEEITTRLNGGEGTAGQLLKNREMYDNLNTAVNELKGLISDIRKDPKKYLNVKVSIF